MDNNTASASITPQRGRSGYPAHLARADEGPRVPLHRRGTSQKLECLEDLLREAGFKETRIFTPEIERVEAAGETRRRQASKIKEESRNATRVNAGFGLFGFLSSLVSRDDREGARRAIDGRDTKTQSLGRLTGKQTQILLNDDGERPKTADGSSDALLTPVPDRRKHITPIILTSDLSSPGSSSSTSSRSRQNHLYASRLAPNAQTNESRTRDHGHLDARMSLRHMMSLPEFVPAKQSLRRNFLRRATEKSQTSATLQSSRGRHADARPRLETKNERLPPLPQNLLAAASSNSGARIDQPQNRKHVDFHFNSTRLRDAQSCTEYERRDTSLVRRGFAPRTPRADTTPGVVTAASVVCHSAPGSRSSSAVRGSRTGGQTHRRKGAASGQCMPCLGATSVQLPGSPKPGSADTVSNAYSHDETASDTADDAYDDSSDEGELDFARLILPARRQRSIQSLRRHLHNHEVASTAGGRGKAPPSAFRNRVPRRTDSQYSIGSRNKTRSRTEILDDPDELLHSRCVSSDEDAEDGLFTGLPGLHHATRKRRGALPWSHRAQGS